MVCMEMQVYRDHPPLNRTRRYADGFSKLDWECFWEAKHLAICIKHWVWSLALWINTSQKQIKYVYWDEKYESRDYISETKIKIYLGEDGVVRDRK